MERLNEIEARKLELKALIETEDADLEAIEKELDALNEEVRVINAQIEEEQRKADIEAEERKKNAEKLNKGEIKGKEIKKMENIITRDSKEYIDAYARYIKTGKDEEVRSLLTENVSGTIAVPTFVYDEVKTAWEKEEITSLIRKLELKGNLKVNFEISSTGAVKHLEGSEAVTEEQLVEGIVTLVPSSFKKWIAISDEVYDMRGEAFLRYIYGELGYRIAKAVANDLIDKIAALGTSATSTAPKAPKLTLAPAQDTIAQAIGNLSDEAANPVVIMNKLTWATFKKAQYDGNYGTDIFEGLRVIFSNQLPAYATASANDVYLIVGDLGYGALANFPNGVGNIEFKFDEMTRKKEDMIEILGREYVGVAPVCCDAFVNVAKPSASV